MWVHYQFSDFHHSISVSLWAFTGQHELAFEPLLTAHQWHNCNCKDHSRIRTACFGATVPPPPSSVAFAAPKTLTLILLCSHIDVERFFSWATAANTCSSMFLLNHHRRIAQIFNTNSLKQIIAQPFFKMSVGVFMSKLCHLCCMMLLVNPQSGRGTALSLHHTYIQPMLSGAGVLHTVVMTGENDIMKNYIHYHDKKYRVEMHYVFQFKGFNVQKFLPSRLIYWATKQQTTWPRPDAQPLHLLVQF